jgi:mycofactocin precursor
MSMDETTAIVEPPVPTNIDVDGTHALVQDELLVEEISIDGMCGVY